MITAAFIAGFLTAWFIACALAARAFIVTAEDMKKPWGGGVFRCGLCGHKFEPGDVARFIYLNGKHTRFRHGNRFVCAHCDGDGAVGKLEAAQDEVAAIRARYPWSKNS